MLQQHPRDQPTDIASDDNFSCSLWQGHTGHHQHHHHLVRRQMLLIISVGTWKRKVLATHNTHKRKIEEASERTSIKILCTEAEV